MDHTNQSKLVMQAEDLAQLKQAKKRLENLGLAVKITNAVGAPIEQGLERLPQTVRQKIISVTEIALKHSVDVALWSIKSNSQQASSNVFHKFAVATTGGVGGFFGMSTLPTNSPFPPPL